MENSGKGIRSAWQFRHEDTVRYLPYGCALCCGFGGRSVGTGDCSLGDWLRKKIFKDLVKGGMETQTSSVTDKFW